MSLLPIETAEITLPELILQNKIGDNHSNRYIVKSQTISVDIYEADDDAWYELRPQSSFPFDSFFLQKKINKIESLHDEFCLQCRKSTDIVNLDISTGLKWLNYPQLYDSLTPEKITASWSNNFSFKGKNNAQDQRGLRTPQLGALHAISAYFSLKKSIEPATVVLPTGTGKTETMLATLVYKQLQKILVIVPGDALRAQISNKFYTLGCLSELGVIPVNTLLPAVTLIKKSIKTVEEAQDLLKHTNVFVATASIFDCSNSEAIDYLCNGITDLFIDEAHHVSAGTWTKIRDRFNGKRILQFTATPFRNNGDDLGGKIIYNYTMGEAQEADYFKHINLIPVEEYFEGEEDVAIAEKAVEVLRKDLDNGFNHQLMARVEKRGRADELLPIYQEIASEYNPVIIYSGMSQGDKNDALNALMSGDSKIAICVKMLGEGFDLPALKVAAIHDIHKSLAITLQFIGRFTRTVAGSEEIGDASAVVNVADPKVESDLQMLYSQSADWDSILRRLSEDRIKREIKLQDVVEELKKKGDLSNQISLWNLSPSFSSILFNADCENWHPEKYTASLPAKSEHWCAISETDKILVVLALYESPVQWGKYKDIHDHIYKLLILKWDSSRSALFAYSNDYQWFKIDKLVQDICNKNSEPISGPKVFNVFNGLKYPVIRNLGGSQIGAISFTQYFGPNVTEGLDKISKSELSLSNMAGMGYDSGEKVIWGCSQKKGKIWSVTGGSISDWVEWASGAWDKVMSGKIDEDHVTKDFLRPNKIPSKYDKYACFIAWGEHIQNAPERKIIIQFGGTEVPLYFVDLEIIDQEITNGYRIAVKNETLSSVYEFIIDNTIPAGYSYTHVSGETVLIKQGTSQPVPLEEYLIKDPWIIQYIDCSYSYNCYLIKLPEFIGEFAKDDIEVWDWEHIDIRKESIGKDREQNTVQWRSFENIKDNYSVIVNDDGSGEAADLIGLKIQDDEIHLGLIHCKYSSKDDPGARITDLYEVCGQAQKSIRWKHSGIPYLYDHIKHRENLWQKDNYSRILKGTVSDLVNIKNRARTVKIILKVYIVQPGLQKDKATSDMLRVLGSTSVYLKNTAQADLLVIGSD